MYIIRDNKIKNLTLYADAKGGGIDVGIAKYNSVTGAGELVKEFENLNFSSGQAKLPLTSTLKKSKKELWVVFVLLEVASDKDEEQYPQFYGFKYKS